MVLSKMNNHEHGTKQTSESYTFEFLILLNQSNFSAFKFSNVSNCFAMKAIKHKISKGFTVTCVFVQIEQSSCTI